ncbi:hypothetical protein ACHQM5_012821 [Ranunculus cassubicifolius]
MLIEEQTVRDPCIACGKHGVSCQVTTRAATAQLTDKTMDIWIELGEYQLKALLKGNASDYIRVEDGAEANTKTIENILIEDEAIFKILAKKIEGQRTIEIGDIEPTNE